MALILQFVNIIVALFNILNKSSCIEFHRATTGVAFSPYVNRIEDGEIPGWKTYDNADVKAMLEVVSKKFSRVYTTGIGIHNVPSEEFDMYQRSNGQAKSAEAAALINRERKSKNLTMLLGIWLHDISERTDVEIQVALESAQWANGIYNETIEGFVFTPNDIHDNLIRSEQILEQLRDLQNSTKLKVGTIQRCTGISGDDKAKGDLSMVRREIVKASDFIICSSVPPMTEMQSGGLPFLPYDLLRFRNEFQKLNPKIEVMGETAWSYQGKESWQNLESFKDHWTEVDKWGAEQNFTVWMFEAIDNPWRTWGAHRGWWRLKKDAFANQTSGYVENVVEPHKDSDGTMVYVGLAIGAIIVAVILGAIVALLYNRVQTLESVLSNEDIKEFMYGLSDKAAAQYEGGVMVPSALKFPYDKSYEIAKDKLKIKRDTLLGSGQFGCVYRAMIENKDGNAEVALKMAKPNCPKTALVGLLSEIKILIYLGQNPNIASIQGAYTAELSKGIVYIATELCSYGSLEDYLRKNPFRGDDDTRETYVNTPNLPENENYDKLHTGPRTSDIKFMDMVRWSHEIACGMEYLGVKQVIHADLATRNVLLDANKTAKITDFGLSRKLYEYTNYVKSQSEPLPWRWLSVESLKFLEFSEKTDVWSYGVTLWEIFAMGELPYPGLSWTLDFVDALVNGLRMKSPTHATPDMTWVIRKYGSFDESRYALMVSCWNLEPEGRPSFSELKQSTAQLRDADRKWDQENSEKLPSSE